MKRAVTGYQGTIGSEFVRRGYIPIKSNITNIEDVYQEIQEINPDIIVHCAALTDVGYCEENEREAFEANVRGTLNVIDSFEGLFVYLSTCHVFPGDTSIVAYRENHQPSPVNVYGLTKWIAEQLLSSALRADHLSIRAGRIFTKDDILPVVEKLKREESVEVTDLIYRSFVYLPHFVDSVESAIQKKLADNLPEEVIHVSGNYIESYYALYNQIARVFDLNNDYVIPRRYKLKNEYPRPFNAGLNTDLAAGYGIKLYSSHEGLEEIKDEYLNNHNDS